jgi:hypothetical protein
MSQQQEDEKEEYALIGFSITRVPTTHKTLWCFIKPPEKDGTRKFTMCYRLDYEPSREHSDFLIKISGGVIDVTGQYHYNHSKTYYLKQRQKEEAYKKELYRRYKENNNSWPITDMLLPENK